MMFRTAFLGIAIAGLSWAADPFVGTWRLDISRSNAVEFTDTYNRGTRSYTEVPGGERVQFDMTLADGRRSKGSYIAHCQKGECSAKEIRWHEVSPGNIEGELFKRGKVIYRYTRTLSDDGKTMTISFFDPNKPTDAPKARQVWGAAVN